MEGVQLPLLPGTKCPGLTAVQECAQDTGSIDLHLGMCRQLLIEPCSLCESREHGSCFANANSLPHQQLTCFTSVLNGPPFVKLEH